VLNLLRSNDYGVKDGIVSSLGTAMGAEGRARLKAMLQEALAAAPKPRSRDWSFDDRSYALAQALAELADVEEDVDAFIAAVRVIGSEAGYAVEIAKRLLKAGRAQEALDWLGKVRVRHNRDLDDMLYHGGWIKDEVTDLRIAALDALGRKDGAQQVRWTGFTETLDVDHLRDHLKRLPDFEDFEAEERAKEIARRFAHPHRALVSSSPGATCTPPRSSSVSGWRSSTAAITSHWRRPRRSSASIWSRRRCSIDG